MRFICLHGAGTNSRIFELQTAALRYELGDEHTFEFVEGAVSCSIFPAVESLATAEDQFFEYYEPNSAASFRKAMEHLGAYISSEGPFDGILAFSQGSSLAAAFIVEQQIQAANGQGSSSIPLRCAIFFSGRLPYIDAGPQSEPDGESSIAVGPGAIDCSTAHIWGINDQVEPGQAQALSELCRGEKKSEYVHQGGHEIPGPRSQDELTFSVHAIRRAIALGYRQENGV